MIYIIKLSALGTFFFLVVNSTSVLSVRM